MLIGQAQPVTRAVCAAGISDQGYLRWRKEYGGLPLEQARRLKDLEKQNRRLDKPVTALSLHRAMMEIPDTQDLSYRAPEIR